MAVDPQAQQLPDDPLAGLISVFEHDRLLLDGLDPDAKRMARAWGIAPFLHAGLGSWTPPGVESSSSTIGHLVLGGLMIRRIEVAGKTASELIGRGDLLQPWVPEDGDATAAAPTWRVVNPVLIAVLDERFAAGLSRWPQIARNLLARGERRSHSLLVRTAIPQVRRADDRLRLLFLELADRWGRVTPEGVVLPLELPNGLIGQLAGMHRPTASRTMSMLADRGEIVRRPEGGFVLDLRLEPSSGVGDHV